MIMGENITVEYAGAGRHVGLHDVRAWWTVQSERTMGNVEREAARAVRKALGAGKGDRVEFVGMDEDTYKSPSINAMITYRFLTAAQVAERAELRARVYATCDGDGCTNEPGQVVRMHADNTERALCYSCWRPIADRKTDSCQVLHWINKHGKVQI